MNRWLRQLFPYAFPSLEARQVRLVTAASALRADAQTRMDDIAEAIGMLVKGASAAGAVRNAADRMLQ